MKKYIIVQVCCLDCKKFIDLFVLPFRSIDECKHYLFDLLYDSDCNDSFIIYNERGEERYSFTWSDLYDNEY